MADHDPVAKATSLLRLAMSSDKDGEALNALRAAKLVFAKYNLSLSVAGTVPAPSRSAPPDPPYVTRTYTQPRACATCGSLEVFGVCMTCALSNSAKPKLSPCPRCGKASFFGLTCLACAGAEDARMCAKCGAGLGFGAKLCSHCAPKNQRVSARFPVGPFRWGIDDTKEGYIYAQKTPCTRCDKQLKLGELVRISRTTTNTGALCQRVIHDACLNEGDYARIGNVRAV